MSDVAATATDAELASTAMARKFDLETEVAILQGKHKAELEPLQEEIKLCETFVKDFMNTAGLQQLKLASGDQAFFQVGTRVGVADFEQVLDYIVAAPAPEGWTEENWAAVRKHIRVHGNWNILNKAANKTAVTEYVEVHQVPPPGVKYDTIRDLQWRRGKG